MTRWVGVELEVLRRPASSAGDSYGLEDALVERPAEERVVDAEEHVADRVVLGEDRLVQRPAPASPDWQHLHLHAGLLREGGQHATSTTANESWVDERDRRGDGRRAGARPPGNVRPRPRARPRAARSVTGRFTRCRRCQVRPGRVDDDREQHAVVERDASRPGPASSLLTPRVDPGSSVSRRSGYRKPFGAHPGARPADGQQRAQVADGGRGARGRGARRTPARHRAAPPSGGRRTPATRAAARSPGSGRAGRRARRPRSTRSHPRVRAASSASSRSVASLASGCRSHHRAGGDRGVDRGRVGGVEVADDDVDARSRARSRDRGRSRRRSRRRAVEGRPALAVVVDRLRRRRARRTCPIGPSAGITRFRFEGSATHGGHPLSPAVPSSPGIRLSEDRTRSAAV